MNEQGTHWRFHFVGPGLILGAMASMLPLVGEAWTLSSCGWVQLPGKNPACTWRIFILGPRITQCPWAQVLVLSSSCEKLHNGQLSSLFVRSGGESQLKDLDVLLHEGCVAGY